MRRRPARTPEIVAYVAEQLAARDRGPICWLDWPYAINAHNGYRPEIPWTTSTGRRIRGPVARYVFNLEHGYWPNYACHRCPYHPFGEHSLCWNPAHIYDGTARQNSADLAPYILIREGLRSSIDKLYWPAVAEIETIYRERLERLGLPPIYESAMHALAELNPNPYARPRVSCQPVVRDVPAPEPLRAPAF